MKPAFGVSPVRTEVTVCGPSATVTPAVSWNSVPPTVRQDATVTR
ncbi:hypothetical protein AB0B31_25160 [Catellatospora citrea]